MIATAFLAPGTFPVTPLQLAGLATGSLFLAGLSYVWLAFAERERPPPAGGGARPGM